MFWLALIGFILSTSTLIFRAFVLTKLWSWFVVPLGVTAISLWWAYGLSLMVSLLREIRPSDLEKVKERDQRENTQIEGIALNVVVAFLASITLLLGYIVKAWI